MTTSALDYLVERVRKLEKQEEHYQAKLKDAEEIIVAAGRELVKVLNSESKAQTIRDIANNLLAPLVYKFPEFNAIEPITMNDLFAVVLTFGKIGERSDSYGIAIQADPQRTKGRAFRVQLHYKGKVFTNAEFGYPKDEPKYFDKFFDVEDEINRVAVLFSSAITADPEFFENDICSNETTPNNASG